MLDKRILLIVDDCAVDRKIYRRYLLKEAFYSYEILEADSAGEGILMYKQKRCDAILLDFCLPDMDGLDFLNKLRFVGWENSTPVIMMTGHGDEEIAVRAMKQGVQDYLVKHHLKEDILRLAVRNAIEKSYLQAQLNKTRERQRLIATTALRIRESLDLEQILQTAVAEVHQLLKCDAVVVYQFTKNALVENVGFFHKKNNYLPYSHLFANEYHNSHCGNLCECNYNQCDLDVLKVYQAGISYTCTGTLDILNTQANLVVAITLPANGKPNEQPWGLLIAHQCGLERKWQTDEREMLAELSVQLAIAIGQAELLAQTQAALSKERQLNNFKSQIVATVSHEYRTPLTSILTAASTVKQHGSKLDAGRQQKFLEIIEDKARYLSKIIDDMLLVNQIELDKTKFKPINLDLQQFFSDLIEEQRLTIVKNHKLIFKIAGNHHNFLGDKGLLRQIFVNLISNAVKYSPNGGNVEFYLQSQDSQILFCVKDEGIGIPTEDKEKLFQSFSRASNVDTIPGTGLGLVITKACVELHGGEISLESQLGIGTTVTVCLPKRVRS